MPAKRHGPVPLAWRVPNAPATFVGRSVELRAIKAASRRGPLIVLCGAGGLGKTALASAAVRDVFPERAARAVMIRANTTEPFRQTLADVVRALGHVASHGASDLAMVAIDLAETRAALIVLEDVHHAITEATSLLVAIARYARRAVWIATSRVVPDAPELAGQIVRLDPLKATHLAKLARIVDPKMRPARAAEIASEAAGSPWKARTLASQHDNTRASDAEKSLLATLSVVERPISTSALRESVGGEVGGAVDHLVRRGLVEAVAGGYRLHDEARDLVASIVGEGGVRESTRTIAALASGDDADALEALRLALKARDMERALAICRASFEKMLRAGNAPTLWELLASCEGAAFGSFKLRTAMQLADVKITTVLDEPPADALGDRLLWVRALSMEARVPEAVVAASALCEAAERHGDERIAFWASLERAMATRIHAGPQRGLDLLEAVRPIDPSTRSLVAALWSFWLAEASRIDDAIRMLERTALVRGAPLESPLADEILGGPLDFFVRYYRMAAFMECGHLERAHAELTQGRATLDVDDQLRASYVQLDGIANLSIARGKLDEAGKILERLLRGSPSDGTVYHSIARLLDIDRRMAAGELADVARDLDHLLAATRVQNPLVHAWCVDTRERLDLALAVRDEEPLDRDSPAGAVAASLLHLRRALRRASWGAPHDAPNAVDVEGTILRSMLLAIDALVSGADATKHAQAAVDLAASHGWGVRECEARKLLAEARLVSGDVHGALASARAIAKKASSMTSRRFEMEARALDALANENAIDFAALEELALEGNVAPCASRRARALLGDSDAVLDAVDKRVLDAARERAGVEIIHVHPTASGHRRGWGLDARRRIAWLPDGRRVSFVRHALLAQVLEVLAREGGGVSFERLAETVWHRRVFHPLHDGNRIRVTFHRLRALVEDDPQKPVRIVLAGAAYSLGGEPFTLVFPK